MKSLLCVCVLSTNTTGAIAIILLRCITSVEMLSAIVCIGAGGVPEQRFLHTVPDASRCVSCCQLQISSIPVTEQLSCEDSQSVMDDQVQVLSVVSTEAGLNRSVDAVAIDCGRCSGW
ncbi:uncharacterized protein MONOS_3568 [Monocercomonoides exilis]|uniref:uncharacterized protein n=1 Tax=Monocercomonoides exilis TaxID=2049356 RepID=UPI00355ACA36|nr:hypothetical protein MONOS_3568 [Monocercomonoides exilis]|eukprot:MONOS_3568.1-p1 / transcript=MONOS_3568.1 / gene=MONOS_3568 / organism=Monocercomonoides_exilis_PA203 / gene_product=unspecified product / transcript_product=unspecified product / location=Mono_scaffold00085:19405-19758(-) / protein_length=118 / sequence_SO=supercontig / SO=protein_coding / is_pseudo=false